jgi:uncharacterized protein YggE
MVIASVFQDDSDGEQVAIFGKTSRLCTPDLADVEAGVSRQSSLHTLR